MRGLVIGMNLVADLEESEGIEMAGIIGNILQDSRQKTRAKIGVVGRDQVGKSERARGFFADEGVVVNLSKSLRGSHFAHAMMERTLRIRGRNSGRRPR